MKIVIELLNKDYEEHMKIIKNVEESCEVLK